MTKRPRFEEMNYPPVDNGVTKWLVGAVVLAAVVAIGYLGYHYWYSCSDFGFFKFCTMVEKPH